MTVFNYGFSNNMTIYIEIEEDTLKCKFTKVTDVIFRNYPMLRIDDLALENCVFENCHTVHFTDCKVSGCQFFGIDTLYADRTPISGCEFEHLRCDNDSVLCLEDSEVSCCTFKDVELTDEAHLISGVGDVWVESCSFEDIRTDRKDRELFFCDETRVDAKTMGLPLDALIVKIPVYNCLTRAGLRTVGDLVRLDIQQILKIKHLGQTVVKEVVDLLHSLDITSSAWDCLR